MVLNDEGQIIAEEWMKSAQIRKEIRLDTWVVMPNHFHGIVWITNTDTAIRQFTDTAVRQRWGDRPVATTQGTTAGPKSKSVGALMAGFKSAVTKRINKMHETPNAKLWQRNYWEHIIRSESELNHIREYICNNPKNWESDKLYVETTAPNVRATGRSPVLARNPVKK